MNKKISKKEAENEIHEFFKDILNKNPKEIKKIRRLAMNKKIPLKELRKTFCKHCDNPHVEPSIRIKNDKLRITCENCDKKSRWKIK
ncbi:hypothetical protein ISS08_01405 [Candidatus Pacearchaeota archaeon]|nr:hypothetical protein [Candidatus Pacearchaeota archaeon]